MKSLGRHIIIEMWEAENLNSAKDLTKALKNCVAAIDGTLLDIRVVEFPVHGVTGVAIISESHVAVHTWPEHKYAAVDIFTCNLEGDVEAGIAALSDVLKPGRVEVMELRRGMVGDMNSLPVPATIG